MRLSARNQITGAHKDLPPCSLMILLEPALFAFAWDNERGKCVAQTLSEVRKTNGAGAPPGRETVRRL